MKFGGRDIHKKNFNKNNMSMLGIEHKNTELKPHILFATELSNITHKIYIHEKNKKVAKLRSCFKLNLNKHHIP